MTDPTIRARCVCTCGNTWHTANTHCPRQPDGPIGYRACYPGAPIYPTRADAEQDWRRHEWGLAATRKDKP